MIVSIEAERNFLRFITIHENNSQHDGNSYSTGSTYPSN